MALRRSMTALNRKVKECTAPRGIHPKGERKKNEPIFFFCGAMNIMNTAVFESDAPFHEGEKALQAHAGSRDKLEEVGSRVIREAMPDQHRSFFAQLPFLLIGLVDPEGQPWASVLAAPPGFVRSPDDRHLDIAALPLAGDAGGASLAEGASIGLLGIQPHTRRRNRANGIVDRVRGAGFSVRITQSFGNCPKYIWPREPSFAARAGATIPPEHADRLDADAMRFIAQADTFFIASAHPQARSPGAARAHGVDVSHRGGPRGFVHVVDERTLVVPDYLGNYFFNTLGNLLLAPRAGLLFIDYDNGDLLQVAAGVRIVVDEREVSAYPGAQRLLVMDVMKMHRLPLALSLRWGQPASLPLHP
ncbi:pyridoxamine 5'-phosphate oxidase family protein [Variovorax sp. dw_308]|uniref:pyridoxamine 5'-phosphate oxidase family protein n=1 Tax=Variovorax sp. dw_308 TaxID=2721546 RepID=UPI00210DD93C|nr:pyridoxamine 5'-phosphate oxidase family protein [Variovorax sp. dw_308]